MEGKTRKRTEGHSIYEGRIENGQKVRVYERKD